MSKLNSLDIDSFNAILHTIGSNHSHYWEITSENIRLAYRILLNNNYTRQEAINSIYRAKINENSNLADEKRKFFFKPIDITKEDIEKITEGLK